MPVAVPSLLYLSLLLITKQVSMDPRLWPPLAAVRGHFQQRCAEPPRVLFLTAGQEPEGSGAGHRSLAQLLRRRLVFIRDRVRTTYFEGLFLFFEGGVETQ